MNAATIIAKKRRAINLTSVEDYDSGAASGNVLNVDFHPNGNFIAAGGNITNKQIIIYSWNGSDTLSEVETVDTGGLIYGLKWHPSGNYLATAEYSDATNTIVIYSWNGSDTLAAVETVSVSAGAFSVDWHPSGDYLAAALQTSTNALRVYSWNGSDTLTHVASATVSTKWAFYVRWSNSGNYLACAWYDSSPDSLTVYAWNGSNTLTIKDAEAYGSNSSANNIRWSSDDAYIFSGATNPATYDIWAWAFDGTSLTLKDHVTYSSGTTPQCWGLDIYNDKYIAASAIYGSNTSQVCLSLYSFSKTTETFTLVDTFTTTASGIYMASFNANGTYIACGMTSETDVSIRMLKVYE